MCRERLQGVELTLQRLLREERVDVIVTRATEPHDAFLHFRTIEVTFVAFVRMPRAWNDAI
jgi:hypothetical protein